MPTGNYEEGPLVAGPRGLLSLEALEPEHLYPEPQAC